MIHKLLQIGDVVKTGDEFYQCGCWIDVKNSVGCCVTIDDVPVRRVIPQAHGYKPIPDVVNTTLPDKAGLYWVKAGQLNTWQIAEVIGNLPFFRIVLHDEWNAKIYRLTDNTIKEWGPRFERYEDKK